MVKIYSMFQQGNEPKQRVKTKRMTWKKSLSFGIAESKPRHFRHDIEHWTLLSTHTLHLIWQKICLQEWKKMPNSQYENLTVMYLRQLKHITAAKEQFTLKGVNTYQTILGTIKFCYRSTKNFILYLDLIPQYRKKKIMNGVNALYMAEVNV